MNGTRFAAAERALADGGEPGSRRTIRQGANAVSPIKLLDNHNYRTLFPFLHPGGRVLVVGQGSTQDFLSVTSYMCDFPTGADQAVITPIYTPQQYDDYNLPIEGSTVPSLGHTDLQNLDISPGNSATLGVIGKAGRRLPFLNQLVPGKGIKPTPYGYYDYKAAPPSSKYVCTPPQGQNAPGTLMPAPARLDRVVNRPLVTVYFGDGGLTWDTEDSEGFTPMRVKLGRGLILGPADLNDESRKPVQVDLAYDTTTLPDPTNISGLLDDKGTDTNGLQVNVDGTTIKINESNQLAAIRGGGGSGAAVWPGPGITIDPPSAPPLDSVTVEALAGAIDDGDHSYALTMTTIDRESTLGTPITVTNSAGNEQNTIAVAAVPTPPINCTGINLYRTKLASPSAYYLLHGFSKADLIAGISYNDNTADAALGDLFATPDPAEISVDLAYDTTTLPDPTNISGLVENKGTDLNGLQVNVDGTTVRINSSNQLVASGGSFGPFTQVEHIGPATDISSAFFLSVPWSDVFRSSGATMFNPASPTVLTAPVTGYYLIHCSILALAGFSGSAGSCQLRLYVAATGGDEADAESSAEIDTFTAPELNATVTFYAQMTAGDTVEAQVSFGKTGGVSLLSAVIDNNHSRFSMMQVG